MMEKESTAFGLVPNLVSRIQTGAAEGMEGRAAGIATQVLAGGKASWRLANVVQSALGKMSGKTARDLLRAYYFSDPNDVLNAIRGTTTQYTPSAMPGMMGRGVGMAVSRQIAPQPNTP
jgi:hypothetical protein